MSGQVLLINPRARRKSGTRKRRTAAQRAATKRMLAANRAKRSHNPIRHRRKRVYRRANPVRSYSHAIRRHRRSRRRNPIDFNSAGIIGALKMGAIGASGGIAVDLLMTYLPLPANLITRTNATTGQVNYLYYATKVGLALAVGAFGKKLVGQKAEQMAEGAIIVNIYDLFRTLATSAGMTLGYYNPGMVVRGMPSHVGAYTNPRMGNFMKAGGLGAYTNPRMGNFMAAGGLSAYTNPRLKGFVPNQRSRYVK